MVYFLGRLVRKAFLHMHYWGAHGSRMEGAGFRGSGFRVQGLGFRLQGFRVSGFLGFRV